MINEREVPPPNDPLLRLVQREGTFWVPFGKKLRCFWVTGSWEEHFWWNDLFVDEVYTITCIHYDILDEIR